MFSSRSSASEPATSSMVTNISVIAIATEIAKVSSGGTSPETTSFCTAIGSATEPSSSSAKPRFSPARSRELDHLLDDLALGPAEVGADGAQDLLGALQAQHVDRLAQEGDAELAALDQHVEVAEQLLGDLVGEDQVGLGDQGADAVVHQPGLDRVVLVHVDLDLGRVQAGAGELALQLVEEVLGQDQRGQHLPVLDLLDRVLAAVGVDALDPLAELVEGLLPG